jgi:hypothetical protein
MEGTAADCGAFGEAVVFLDYFKDLPDPRQRGKVLYRLDEVLLLCLLAVLAGSEAITDIARFGEKKLERLRRFRPFRDGTPAHDHLGDILALLDAEAFQRCFVAWVAALTGAPGDVIAIDGKTAAMGCQRDIAKKNPGKESNVAQDLPTAFFGGAALGIEREFNRTLRVLCASSTSCVSVSLSLRGIGDNTGAGSDYRCGLYVKPGEIGLHCTKGQYSLGCSRCRQKIQ